MSVRTFIFCDVCNQQGIRTINNRRIKNERRTRFKKDTKERRKMMVDVFLIAEPGTKEV